MPDSFDPYFEWLGIENSGRPPDYYRLLGLEQFESDPESIGRAADAAMAQVRRVRPGPHLAEWSQLLDHLGATKVCLLDPLSKKAYDAGLRERQSPVPATPDAWSIPAEQPAAELSPILFEPVPISNTSAASSGMAPIIAGLLVLAVAAGGVFVYATWQRTAKPQAATPERTKPPPAFAKTAKPQAEKPETANLQAENLQAENLQAENLQAENLQAEKLQAENSEAENSEAKKQGPESENPTPAVDAKMTAAFAQAAADARTSLAKRDLAAASKHLKAASAHAQTREDRGRVDRLETMLDNLTQFWNGIRTSMAKLQAAEELALGDTRIMVIESSRDYLKVKAEGRVRRFQVATMPTSLVMVLVDQYFGKDPGSRAIVGTFLAVDPNGNRALAKQYWQEAARAGIDSEKLLRELDGF